MSQVTIKHFRNLNYIVNNLDLHFIISFILLGKHDPTFSAEDFEFPAPTVPLCAAVKGMVRIVRIHPAS